MPASLMSFDALSKRLREKGDEPFDDHRLGNGVKAVEMPEVAIQFQKLGLSTPTTHILQSKWKFILEGTVYGRLNRV